MLRRFAAEGTCSASTRLRVGGVAAANPLPQIEEDGLWDAFP